MSRTRLVDLDNVEVRYDKPDKDAIAVFAGTRKEGREVWVWLPREFAEVNTDGTVTLPEWLAIDKGLV